MGGGRASRLAFVAIVATLLTPVAASAADSLYWTDYGRGLVVRGKLDGRGTPSTLYTDGVGPAGLSLEPAVGKLYWSDIPRLASQTAPLHVGSLRGGGKAGTIFPGGSQPNGVAADPALGKLFWADTGVGEIRVGNLNGTGQRTLFSGLTDPTGVAIDPAHGKIFWTDSGSGPNTGRIYVGNLDGSGQPKALFKGEDDPSGLALDARTGELYWSEYQANAIRFGNVFASRPPETLLTDPGGPFGVAIDPGAGRLYWTDFAVGKIRVANLNGGGNRSTIFGDLGEPDYLALLRKPTGFRSPHIEGKAHVGRRLSCGGASWAGDLPGSGLYRSPQHLRYAWYRNGRRVAVRSGKHFTPHAPGRYRCVAMAKNAAGVTGRRSRPRVVAG